MVRWKIEWVQLQRSLLIHEALMQSVNDLNPCNDFSNVILHIPQKDPAPGHQRDLHPRGRGLVLVLALPPPHPKEGGKEVVPGPHPGTGKKDALDPSRLKGLGFCGIPNGVLLRFPLSCVLSWWHGLHVQLLAFITVSQKCSTYLFCSLFFVLFFFFLSFFLSFSVFLVFFLGMVACHPDPPILVQVQKRNDLESRYYYRDLIHACWLNQNKKRPCHKHQITELSSVK